MKSFLSLIFGLVALSCAGQISVSNFEVWTSTPENGLLPENWTSDNTPEHQTVIQELNAYEGNYAMRVTAIPIGVGDYGYASTTIPINYIPAALTFFAKTAVVNAGVQVEISFFNGQTLFETFSWFGNETLTEWTEISIPLTQNEPILTHAVINVIASVGDLVPGSAQITVDQMALINTLGTSNKNVESGVIYPNPTSGEVNISSRIKPATAKVYNSNGKLVKTIQFKQNTSTFSLNGLPKGEYIIRFESAEGKYLHSGKVVLVE